MRGSIANPYIAVDTGLPWVMSSSHLGVKLLLYRFGRFDLVQVTDRHRFCMLLSAFRRLRRLRAFFLRQGIHSAFWLALMRFWMSYSKLHCWPTITTEHFGWAGCDQASHTTSCFNLRFLLLFTDTYGSNTGAFV